MVGHSPRHPGQSILTEVANATVAMMTLIRPWPWATTRRAPMWPPISWPAMRGRPNAQMIFPCTIKNDKAAILLQKIQQLGVSGGFDEVIA